MMTLYNAEKTFAAITEKIKKGHMYALSGGQYMSDNMLISKAIMLLANTKMFNQYIREWYQMNENDKTSGKFKIFFQQARRELHEAITTVGTSNYTAPVNHFQELNNVYVKEERADDTYEALEAIK